MRAMLHLAKLAVGTRDVADLRRWQATRTPLRHLTRNLPRRRDEVLSGGSLYWVVNGAMVVRQRVLDITEETRGDGTGCCALVLDRDLVPVLGRPTRPFQGWRYLEHPDAPADLGGEAGGLGAMPPALVGRLAELALI